MIKCEFPVSITIFLIFSLKNKDTLNISGTMETADYLIPTVELLFPQKKSKKIKHSSCSVVIINYM